MCTYGVDLQVRDTLGALAERFAALKLDNGGLHLSRLARMHSKAMALKRIVMYSPAWVKSQNRMASTSNQVCVARLHFLCTLMTPQMYTSYLDMVYS